MGGRTGYAFAQRYPERVVSLVIGGAAPSSPKLEENRIRRWARALTAGEPSAIAQALGVPDEFVTQRFADGEPRALAAAQLGLLSWEGAAPATLTMPSLHYAGERDPIMPGTRAAAQAMPNADFKLLPGLNHLTGFARSNAAILLAREFLQAQAGGGRQEPSGT